MKLKLLFVLVMLGAQVKSQDLDSLVNLEAFTKESELQKVINQKTAISAGEALTTRENPGIISIITKEEIQSLGARDIVDILKTVPGFEIAQDLQFVSGLGLRGNWSNEGKILVMVDGQEYNELMYQTVAVINRFPVDLIERIEIIRGPGSALYGGTAEYGVINIITKNAADLNGISISGAAGIQSGNLGRKNAGVMVGQTTGDLHWDAAFYQGKSIISDQQFQDLFEEEDPVNLGEISRVEPMNINAGFRYKGLSVRAIYDDYYTNDPFLFVSFKNFFTDVKYDINIGEKIRVSPQFKYTNQIPWAYGDRESEEYEFKIRAERYNATVNVDYAVSRKVNFTLGAVYFNDKATDLLKDENFDGNEFSMHNVAVFAQGFLRHRIANVTAGMRVENNSEAGSSFVPRFALTKKIENFHFKTLYSKSFRAPGIQNINVAENGQIKPERSSVLELELGYQFTPEMLLTANAYRVSTRNVIIYLAEQIAADEYSETYRNYERSGTSGIEILYSFRKKRWNTTLAYSHYVANKKNSVDTYSVPENDKVFIAFPADKLSLVNNISLTDQLNFNLSFLYSGKRYAYTAVDEEGTPVLGVLDDYLQMNAFLNYRDMFLKGLSLGAGVYDISNVKPAIPQAYNGEYAPIPGLSREFIVKLSYSLTFNQ